MLGPLLTIVLSCLALPITFMTMFLLTTSLYDYDSTGQGGPFRSCTPDSAECTGVNPLGVLLYSAVLVGVTLGIGLAGQAAAAFPSRVIGRICMTALSAAVTVTGAAILIRA